MRFRELAGALEKLEGTARRTESRDVLVDLVRALKPPDLAKVVYFVQGLLRPEYEGVELGVASSLARRAVALVTHLTDAAVASRARASGDLGTTTEELLRHAPRLEPADPLDVAAVYDGMMAIARAQGEGAQEEKVRQLAHLLSRCTPVEGRFVVRFAVGSLRVGAREMTILDAFAKAFAPDSDGARERIEAAFNLTSDLGALAEVLAQDGITGISKIRLTCGRPIRPMLAERAADLDEIVERMGGEFAVEYKYDGLRVQAHVARSGTVRLFSRRLENIGSQFPELVEAIPRSIRRSPAILEGECVPIDPETGAIRPFQSIGRRRGRKYDLERFQSEVPVVLFLFDLLLEGGEETYLRPFGERRAALERLVSTSEKVRLADQARVGTAEEARRFFDTVVAEGAEGIVAKSLAEGSSYRAGARGFWWIKYKRDYQRELADSIDGVVVGGFYGRGRRAGRFGAYLLAVYDRASDRYPTFCKVGSGLDDALLDELPKRLAPFASAQRPDRVDTLVKADQWFQPRLVLEVRGAELTESPVHRAAAGLEGRSEGLALRFPRLTSIRSDKGPTDATTTDELVRLYAAQRAVKSKGSSRSALRHRQSEP